MFASSEEIEALLKLQEVDVVSISAQKKLDDLPQRDQLQQLASKKQDVVAKQGQVQKMLDNAQRKVSQIEDEQAILERKREDTQEKIDTSGGDFRAVQSLTRDLDGIAKRLATLEDEQLAAAEKLEQVEAVKSQIDNAISVLDSQALGIRAQFQEQAAALQRDIADAQGRHDGIAAGIGKPLYEAYLTARKRCGGVGIATLVDGRCNTCRSAIDENRLLVIKREAPVSTCPSCRRMLIIP